MPDEGETVSPGDLWVVAVPVDGIPLAVVGCDEHLQPLIDGFMRGATKTGRTIGALVDCGRLADLPNAPEVRIALIAALGRVGCPGCLPQKPPEQGGPPEAVGSDLP